jgi:hypothetical protein
MPPRLVEMVLAANEYWLALSKVYQPRFTLRSTMSTWLFPHAHAQYHRNRRRQSTKYSSPGDQRPWPYACETA